MAPRFVDATPPRPPGAVARPAPRPRPRARRRTTDPAPDTHHQRTSTTRSGPAAAPRQPVDGTLPGADNLPAYGRLWARIGPLRGGPGRRISRPPGPGGPRPTGV